MNWMIYGANGYTGKRIAIESKRRNMTPILAGRREETIRPLAEELGLPWRAFSLDAPEVADTDLVLHCAGPFSQTSQKMANALIPKGKHYLDITGEIEVFESLFARRKEAENSGSIVIPGVGFDVVPTDCLAATLKAKLPDATHLELAMSGPAVLSPGTVKSMIEGFGKGGWIRENGKLKSVPTFAFGKHIRFLKGTHYCNSIPWGDVATSFYSTQIPNMIFYAKAPSWSAYVKPVLPYAQNILNLKQFQDLAKAAVDKLVKGPSDDHLATAKMHIWGEVRNAQGAKIEARLEVPEGYRFTVLSSLKAVEKILAGAVQPGVHTPSLAFGKDFISEFPETKLYA